LKFYIHHLQNFDIQKWPVLEIGKCGCCWDEILYSSFAKFQYIKMTFPMKSKKCGCLYDMKFYNHLQKFWYTRMVLSLKSESVVASMRWNSIFIICKISVCKNDPVLEIRNMWLPLWDEILDSSSGKFRYTRMSLTLTLKSKKCGCLWDGIPYLSSAKCRYIRMALSLKSKKCGCLPPRWNSIFIICKISIYKNDPILGIGNVWLPLWNEVLYSSSAKFWYTRMNLTLKSKKCGYVE